MHLLCRVGYHSWGKYSLPYVRVMTGPLPFSRKYYSEYRSLRCSRCMLQVDEVTVKYLDYDNGAMDRRVPIWDVPVDCACGLSPNACVRL